MKRSYLILVVLVVLAAAAYLIYQRTRAEEVVLNLVTRFTAPDVEKRSSVVPLAEGVKSESATIKGESKVGIFMHPTSRLTFKRVTIPESASLHVFLAVKEDAWDKPSDGVLFRFAVSAGPDYEELLNQHVDPANKEGDRRWIEQRIDLSAYAGQQVDLIFNTNSSLPGRGDNGAYDFAVWGSPSIVARR